MRKILLSVFLVTGCGFPPLEQNPGVLSRAPEPLYQWQQNGVVAASSCASGKPSGYGVHPSGCAVDNAFGRQVANVNDMVSPRNPGPGYAARPARAAYSYIFGIEYRELLYGKPKRPNRPEVIEVPPEQNE